MSELTINNCIAYLFKNVDKLHGAEFIKLVNLKNKYLNLRRNTDDELRRKVKKVNEQ